jgi:hypothetical protein
LSVGPAVAHCRERKPQNQPPPTSKSCQQLFHGCHSLAAASGADSSANATNAPPRMFFVMTFSRVLRGAHAVPVSVSVIANAYLASRCVREIAPPERKPDSCERALEQASCQDAERQPITR